MMDLKIIHMADMHFDAAFAGLSETGKAAVRRQDLRDTFSKIIHLAQNADMLFISGDLFDGKTVSRTTLEFLKREFLKIKHVKVFIAAGNHDCFDADSVYTSFRFGDNVHIFGTKPELVETEEADIYGVSFQAANEQRELLTRFSVKNPDKTNLLVMHGNLIGDGYNPISLSDLENCGMDYVALGHIHAASGLQSRGTCFYAYPGCPEGHGFDETGEKGVLSLTVGKGHAAAEFIPVQQRMYINCEIDVSEAETPEEIAAGIAGAFQGEQHLYRFRLTGRSSFPIDTEALKSNIHAFDVSVLDETAPAVNVECLSEEFTLKGLFTKFALADKANMDDEEFGLAFKAGLSILEKEERNENR